MRLQESLSMFAAVAIVAAAAATASAQRTPLPSEEARVLHQEASQLFRAGHYAAAYGRFMRAADSGYGPSAEAALFMLQNGPRMFGTNWTASVPQQAGWRALVMQEQYHHTVAVGVAYTE